jgi:hypothetical protein
MSYRILSLGVAVLGLIATLSQPAAAADHAAIAPYLTDDVSDVAYLDLTRVDLPTIVDELLRIGIIPEPAQVDAQRDAATMQETYAALRKLGARRAYVLFRVSDVAEKGMTWIVEIDRGGNAADAAKFLNKWRQEFTPPAGTPAAELRDFFLPKEFTAINETIVAAGTEKQLSRVKNSSAKGENRPRADFAQALAALGDADVGLAILGDAESRRVVREMFPQLPAPFIEIDGKLLADGVRWASVGATFPPKFQLTITADASTLEIAKTLEQSIGKAMVIAKAFLLKESIDGPPAHQERAKGLLPLISLVTPKVDGTRLTLTFGDDEPEIAFVRDFVPAMTQKMRTKAYISERINQFKQMALAMHNYLDAKKTFPPQANADGEGRPLLSWRVHVLPYLDQSALYDQFHLNEPWDSEHNRKLIEKMPAIYTDPDPAVRSLTGDDGRTTYVVPNGEGLAFDGSRTITIHDFKDGTSDTVLIVDAAPEEAVVWTKPDDWQVDLKEPLTGLKGNNRETFTAAYADGSVRLLGLDIEPEKLRALLTREGGEVIER